MLWKSALHALGRSLHRVGQAGQGVRIGLALGGGFARGAAHIGVLRVLERAKIPIHCIGGVSAGSVVASSYASGRTPEEVAEVARGLKFRDVARWTVNFMGVLDSERMEPFLQRALKVHRFEAMPIPLAVVACDLRSGQPVVFRKYGEVPPPVRASCSYPGLFKPVEYHGRLLVDGLVGMEVPAKPLQEMGATHVVSVYLPPEEESVDPLNLAGVVSRCFGILSSRTEHEWRRHSDLVLVPDVADCRWDSFDNVDQLIRAGEAAAEKALPQIADWLRPHPPREPQ
jgi:NTE family protein